MQQQAISQMRVGNIRQGRNPRTYFDPVEMAEMEASVSAKGVINEKTRQASAFVCWLFSCPKFLVLFHNVAYHFIS